MATLEDAQNAALANALDPAALAGATARGAAMHLADALNYGLAVTDPDRAWAAVRGREPAVPPRGRRCRPGSQRNWMAHSGLRIQPPWAPALARAPELRMPGASTERPSGGVGQRLSFRRVGWPGEWGVRRAVGQGEFVPTDPAAAGAVEIHRLDLPGRAVRASGPATDSRPTAAWSSHRGQGSHATGSLMCPAPSP
jgi:hypothetical protein